MPTSDSYFDDLILRLKDPSYAAVYLETHFELEEDEEPDPKLIRLALSNVAEALGEQKMTPEQAKLHLEKLDELLSKRGSEAIYNLGNWLNALGLKLTVAVAQEPKDSLINCSGKDSEIAIS
jgi:DNA-binding phage protein